MESQVTDAEPFISAFVFQRWWADSYIEIFNPNNGEDVLDLSRYMVLLAPLTLDENSAISRYQTFATTDGMLPATANNYYTYTSGYKFNYDNTASGEIADYTWKDAVIGGITVDINVDASVAPNDVFVPIWYCYLLSSHPVVVNYSVCYNTIKKSKILIQ